MARSGARKRLLSASIIGEQGVALAKLLVLEMGSAWHDTKPGIEAGIDGNIELRDPTTGVMLNQWIAAQVKAHQGQFVDEDETSFVFACEQRDLDYWADGSTPVVLIVTRPEDRAAWWKHIGPDTPRSSASKVALRFEKKRDRLGPHSYEALRSLRPVQQSHAETFAEPQRVESGFRVPYRSLGPSPLMPVLPLRLRGPAAEIRAIAIVDTGAETSCFPYALANELGIDLSACEDRATVTASGASSMHVWPEDLVATVVETEVRLKGVFGPTPIALLGRNDFLASFRITFDQRSLSFVLSPFPDDESHPPRAAAQ